MRPSGRRSTARAEGFRSRCESANETSPFLHPRMSEDGLPRPRALTGGSRRCRTLCGAAIEPATLGGPPPLAACWAASIFRRGHRNGGRLLPFSLDSEAAACRTIPIVLWVRCHSEGFTRVQNRFEAWTSRESGTTLYAPPPSPPGIIRSGPEEEGSTETCLRAHRRDVSLLQSMACICAELTTYRNPAGQATIVG